MVGRRLELGEHVNALLLKREGATRGIGGRGAEARGLRIVASLRRLEARCEGVDARRIEDVLEREGDAEAFAQARQHLRDGKRIRAEGKHVLVGRNLLDLQDFRPHGGQRRLHVRARRH